MAGGPAKSVPDFEHFHRMVNERLPLPANPDAVRGISELGSRGSAAFRTRPDMRAGRRYAIQVRWRPAFLALKRAASARATRPSGEPSAARETAAPMLTVT